MNEIEKLNHAWARLLKATAKADYEWEHAAHADWFTACIERDRAKEGLRSMGVNVDELLKDD